MSDYTLRIVTPEKNFFHGSVEELVFSTPEGSMGVRAGHMQMVAAVAEGLIKITKDGSDMTAAISQGVAEISEELVEMFVDTVEWADEIDTLRAQRALERAQLSLQSTTSRIEFIKSQAAMARALARLRAASNSGG